MTDEEFKTIPGWPAYAVDKSGQVKRLAPSTGATVGRILKWSVSKKFGYASVWLSQNKSHKQFLVHRLVAMTHIGDPEGMFVCHFDGDKLNNSVTNLRIDTHQSNMQDEVRLGKTARGEKNGNGRYTKETVASVKCAIAAGVCPQEIRRAYNLPKGTFDSIKSGKTWFWLEV